MVLDVGGLSLQTLSGRNSDGERLVGHRSTLLHVPLYGKLWLSKASPGGRRVFLVPREMHVISYGRIPGREKGKAVLGVACRTSEWGLISGKPREKKVGTALTTQIREHILRR